MSKPLDVIRKIALGSQSRISSITKDIIRQFMELIFYLSFGFFGLFFLAQIFPEYPYSNFIPFIENSVLFLFDITVSHYIWHALVGSLELFLLALGIALIISIPLGILAAKKEGKFVDKFICFISYGNFGLPVFACAKFFGYLLFKLYPSSYRDTEFVGYSSSPDTQTGFHIIDLIRSPSYTPIGELVVEIIFASVTLSLVFISILLPAIKCIWLNKHIQTDKKGFGFTSVNASFFGLVFANLCGIEYLFGFYGISSFVLNAIRNNDFTYLFPGLSMVLLIFLSSNFVINLYHNFRRRDLEQQSHDPLEPRLNSVYNEKNANGGVYSVSRRLKSHLQAPSTITGIILLLLLIISGFLAPFFHQNFENFGRITMGPHFFFGVIPLLLVAVGVSSIGFLIGVPLGFISGYKGGIIGKFFTVCGNGFMLLPPLLLYILGKTVFSRTFLNELIFLSIFSVIIVEQLTRHLILNFQPANRPFTTGRQVVKKLLPQLIGFFFQFCAFVVIFYSTSSYLGWNEPTIIGLGESIHHHDHRSEFYLPEIWGNFGLGFLAEILLIIMGLSFILIAYGFNNPTKTDSKKKTEKKSSNITLTPFTGENDSFFE